MAGGGSGGWGVNGNIPEDWRLDKQSVDSGLDRAVDMYIPPTIGVGYGRVHVVRAGGQAEEDEGEDRGPAWKEDEEDSDQGAGEFLRTEDFDEAGAGRYRQVQNKILVADSR